MDGFTPALATIRGSRSRTWLSQRLSIALLSITTILGLANHQYLYAQQVATKAPPPQAAEQDAETPQNPLPDLPHAVLFDTGPKGDELTLESDLQARHGDIYTLDGKVVITYRGHTIRADRISYDAATAELAAEGHLFLSGGENDEFIQATRGTYNLNTQTGRFYEVSGSVGIHGATRHTGYDTPNPFLFSGRMVVKTGPQSYDVYDGKVTSCLLPRPDWQLFSGHFSLDSEKARAYNSTFRLVNVPILFLPYVTHPIDSQARQSGIMIPILNPHSTTKGTIVGEDFYFTLGRSADLTVGMQFFSLRGFSESGTFRYKGIGNDFVTAHVIALQDRGILINNVLNDQGGQDITVAFRHKLTSRTRVQGDAEYLSSYTYREAFNESFNQAVSSDITSVLFAVNQQNGFSTAIRADRYQGLKRVPITTRNARGVIVSQPGQEVRLFHAPSLDFTALDRRIGPTPFLFSLESSLAGLKRTQPNFTSSGIIERLDVRPEISLPLAAEGWHTLSSIAVRETFYSRSRTPTAIPTELVAPLNRASVEAKVDLRAPIIERDFHPPAFLAKLFGPEVRHTVEPQLVYHYVHGIDNFLSVLRFDDVDIASNTNEVEYGVMQRLFARKRPLKAPRPCANGELPPPASEAIASELPDTRLESDGSLDANGIATPDAPALPTRTTAHAASKACAAPESQQHEWMSWKIAQKRFFDSTFGGAIVATRRNIFDTTLSFSGIAFLTEPRDITPLISRLRVRTSSHTDVEWDFDLDTGAKRFTSSNVFLDAHEGPVFGAVSYARLNAPGRSFQENIDNNNIATLTSSATSDFSQMRVLLGYGTPTKPGLSAAANAGFNLKQKNLQTGQEQTSLQYGALQTSYNWNCCGISVEYRKYELGSVRNEGTYKFSFTLANIGTAGNLRRTERLF